MSLILVNHEQLILTKYFNKKWYCFKAIILAMVILNWGCDSNNLERENVKRLDGYKFIQPLISVRPIEEYKGFSRIKETVQAYIIKKKTSGVLNEAAVYFQDFKGSNWTTVNPDIKFSIGSIFKVPVLIAFLKEAQVNRGLLNKEVLFDIDFSKINKDQEIKDEQIELGKTYTVRELLTRMIVNSDNNALFLLENRFDMAIITKVFKDLGLEEPDYRKIAYESNVVNISLFMEVLFNATYLNKTYSEFAVDLLTKATFKEGIVKGIPEASPLVAHKFGESGNKVNRQLSEMALLYINKKPYLITIMTKGNDNIENTELEKIIQDIAHIIYYQVTKLNS